MSDRRPAPPEVANQQPDNDQHALARGKVSNLDQYLTVVASVVADGSAAGMRAIDARVWNGIDVRLLPDRGLDIGSSWFRGVPLAWISPVGETPPPAVAEMSGTRWRDSWPGGLMTTCGLSNVGEPSDGWGLHGTYTAQPARDVVIERTDDAITVKATIADPPFELQRSIATSVGQGLVRVDDRVINVSGESAAAPMLYHVNIGFPVLDAGARIESDASEVVPLEDYKADRESWTGPPDDPPADGAATVYEHLGASWARLINPRLGVAVTVRSSLPRLWQWIDPSSGVYALGLEPANCSVRGREVDIAAEEMPFIDAHGTRDSWLTIEAEILE